VNIRWLALVTALLCCPVAATAAAPDAPRTPEQAPLPQVDIEAERAKLHAMEAQLYALEDQFFTEYNQFNDNVAYKVKCGWEMKRQFRVHQCKPVFQEWAERGGGFTSYGSTGNYFWSADADRNTVWYRTRDYQKNMIALIEKHPELLKPLKERAELGERYKELRKKFIWD
jgi:hypothetical protein